MDKKIFIGLMTMLMLFATIGGAMAAGTFDTPTSSSRIRDTQFINISTGLNNPTSCVLTFTSSITANTSETKTLVNSTDGITEITTLNNTINTREFEDGNDYGISATCYNSSNVGGANSSTITAISSMIFDNSEPTAATSRTPADGTTDTDGTVTFSSTVGGNVTTSCELVFDSTSGCSPGAGSYAMDNSGDTCSLILDNMPQCKSGYYWTVKASDETNETLASYNLLKVATSGSMGAKAVAFGLIDQTTGQAPTTKSSTPILIILLIIGGLFVFGKKKGKKK